MTTVKTELQSIQKADPDRMLHAAKVVEWARTHRGSALWAGLEWDNAKAAHEWRLSQARQLIVVHMVTVQRAPEMISLTIDRVQGGGYRSIEDVVKVPDLRDIMLRDALADLVRAKTRYQRITELAGIWGALDAVCAAAEAKRKRPERPKPKRKSTARKTPGTRKAAPRKRDGNGT